VCNEGASLDDFTLGLSYSVLLFLKALYFSPLSARCRKLSREREREERKKYKLSLRRFSSRRTEIDKK